MGCPVGDGVGIIVTLAVHVQSCTQGDAVVSVLAEDRRLYIQILSPWQSACILMAFQSQQRTGCALTASGADLDLVG